MKWMVQLLAVLLLVSLSSCMKDDLEDCGVKIRFRYTYNMKNADAFIEEVSAVKVWLFDEAGKLVEVFGKQQLEQDPVLRLPHQPEGSYTLVAMAKSGDETGEYADFEVPDLSPGAPIDSLWARLQRDERSTNTCCLNTWLMGMLAVELTGEAQQLVMDMMKCTHRLRILLVPITEEAPVDADSFDFWIEGRNGWLAYDATTYREEPIVYRPYYQTVIRESKSGSRQENVVHQAIVAELSTSRLIYELEPRLKIRHREQNMEFMDINLTGLLSLQAIQEHQQEWSRQEYLDRQDEYTLTFLMDGSTWMQGKIIVNGWALTLRDVGL